MKWRVKFKNGKIITEESLITAFGSKVSPWRKFQMLRKQNSFGSIPVQVYLENDKGKKIYFGYNERCLSKDIVVLRKVFVEGFSAIIPLYT